MKSKTLVVLLILSLVVAGFTTNNVEAGAYSTQFTTSVTYQNVGTGPATIDLVFYPENNGVGIPITLPELASLAGASIYVGSVGTVADGFRGTAVMSSNQPLVSTMVQVPEAGGTVKVRPLSNGLTSGTGYVLVPTVLKNKYDYTTLVSVQNVDASPADLNLFFVPVTGAPIPVETNNIPVGSSKFYDLGLMSEIPAGFTGSLQVYATKAGTTTSANVIASAMELAIAGNGAYAFEGATDFATLVYMPSALCQKYNADSSYAVQNTTAGEVSVTVRYSNGINDGPHTLAAGAKKSFLGCAVNPAGFIGSATIEATGGIVAMGKIYGGGLTTAFLGFTGGAARVALPYVRWTTAHWTDGSRQRAYIAVQNVGDALAAGAVVVEYYNNLGFLVGTDPMQAIPAGGKVNSNAESISPEFGYYADGSFGGSAIVRGPAGSQLAVIVRIQSTDGALIVGEDYSGIPLP